MRFNLGEESFYSNVIKVKCDNKPIMNIVISVTHFPCSIQLNMHRRWNQKDEEKTSTGNC